MPTYEYECTKCDHQFEHFQSMSSDLLKRCPKCRCKLRRLFGSGAGIIFKGSGFYETDYRSKSYRDGESKAKSEASPSSDSSSSKSDKKAPEKKKAVSK
jgi:putative FmdB family regulatory protein